MSPEQIEKILFAFKEIVTKVSKQKALELADLWLDSCAEIGFDCSDGITIDDIRQALYRYIDALEREHRGSDCEVD